MIRGPLLNPLADGTVAFTRDAVIEWDDRAIITFAGAFGEFGRANPQAAAQARRSVGVLLPPLADCHIHIPQHPIRGRFLEEIEADPPQGRLIAGLNRNVFPAEARCADPAHAEQVVQEFLEDTLRNGVIGGAAYMTVHPQAAAVALRMLPATWSVGLVLMNMNCPQYLRTDEASIERDIRALAEEFGRRVIVTDRFAVTSTSPLRRRGAELARELGLRMQTHLNEQPAEKELVEKTLYPQAAHYTDVYRRDGLLDRSPIMAHCIHNHPEELAMLRDHGATIAHCPVSNALLGSGVMPLDAVVDHGIDYALCTDVGASPTTSLLVEMAQFLHVHRGRSKHATASEALQRATRAPARIMRAAWSGTLEPGQPASFIEIECDPARLGSDDVEQVIGQALLADAPAEEVHARVDQLEGRVMSVRIEGRLVFQRETRSA